MRRILTWVLALMLCAGIGGGAYALYRHYNPKDDTAIENPIESPDDSGTNTAEPALTAPANEATLVESKMLMEKGAEAYLNDSSEGGVLRFKLTIEKTFLEQVQADENKKICMAVAPLRFFDEVNTENKTYMDWATAFIKNESPVELIEVTNFTPLNDTHSYVNFRLNGIPYGGVNMRIAAIGILVDESGETPVYKYSKMPDGETYRTNARSLAYAAGEELNAVALGEVTHTEEEMAKLNSYVNMAVDYRNGLSAATDDNSKPMLTFVKGTKVTVKEGETHLIEYQMTPAKLDMPIRFVSADSTIAAVSKDGIITAVKEGSTTIQVCIAGVVSTVAVTVTK